MEECDGPPSADRSSASDPSWYGDLSSDPHKTALLRATSQGNVTAFMIRFEISDGIFTQCFSPNYNLCFGLLVTVHPMDHWLNILNFIFNLRQLVWVLNSRLSHRSIIGTGWTWEADLCSPLGDPDALVAPPSLLAWDREHDEIHAWTPSRLHTHMT